MKVAQLGKGPTAGTANVPPAADTVAASDPTALATWVPVPAPMAITFSDQPNRWGVVALRTEADGSSSFLVGRSGRALRVVSEKEVDETFYESNPDQHEPRVGS